MVELSVLVIAIPVMIAVFAALMRRQNLAATRAAAEWGERPLLGEREFLEGCEIPAEPFREQVALAARRAIAILGQVPTGTIHPGDAFKGELSRLPFWESLDWPAFVQETERLLQGQAMVPGTRPIDQAVEMAGGGRNAVLRVEHVVRSVALGAVPYESAE
jgi:hypothetical protein